MSADESQKFDERLRALSESVRKVDDSARAVDQLILVVREEISRLENERLLAENRATDAEERATDASRSEQEALDKCDKAIALKEGRYDELIAEIFERPKNELFDGIKKQINLLEETIWNRSSHSMRTTVVVATVSFLVSILLSSGYNLYLQRGTAEQMKMTTQELAQFRKETQPTMKRLETASTEATTSIENAIRRLTETWRLIAISDPKILDIMELTQKHSKQFRYYSSLNLLSLAYRMRFVYSSGPNHYEQYLAAFKKAKLPVTVVPSDEDVLRTWDRQTIRLYSAWLEAIEKVEDDEIMVTHEHRLYKSFQHADDATDFGAWRYKAEKLTYGRLRDLITKRREKFVAQLRLNDGITADE